MLFLSYKTAFRAISSAEKLSFLSEMKNGEYLFDDRRRRGILHRQPFHHGLAVGLRYGDVLHAFDA